MMISDFRHALKDVFSSKIIMLVLFSILLALAVFAILFLGFSYMMSSLPLTGMPKVQKTAEIMGYILFFIMSLMLFPPVITFVSSFFIDSAIERLAAKNDVCGLRAIPLSESLLVSGVVSLKGISLSILLIPVTVLLSWIPFVNFLPVIVYYVLNGRLLAREYFFAVALRYMEKCKAEDLFNRYRLYWDKAGVIIAVLMTVPVVNTVSPLIAAAFMQRVFWKKNPDRKII